VVAALQRLAIALCKGHLAGAVAAYVVVAVQLAIKAVSDDDWLVEDRRRHEIARPRKIIETRNELPRAAENPLLLALEYACIQVEG
jgi:hypothetical protein